MSEAPRIAFIGWNPFQFLHVVDIARELRNSYLVIEKRRSAPGKFHIDKFDEHLLCNPDLPAVVWNPGDVGKLDGVFDVIVCQTPFTRIHKITHSRIAMIQYGYAKEVHNYGAWRAFADLSLTYGAYAARKMETLCPVVEVGIPRFDKWHSESFIDAARAKMGPRLDPGKPTLLYVPTWGDLSTSEDYLDAVLALAGDYNLLIKLHHNTALLEPERRAALVERTVHVFGANDDLLELLAASDIVLSDYSGAIFDAIYCRKPVVLLHGDFADKAGNKLDEHSIEHARRHHLGVVVESPEALRSAVDGVASGALKPEGDMEALRSELFVPGPGSTARAVEAIERLARGEYRQTQIQSYIRAELRLSYSRRKS